ncbi:hypothetical protein S83_023542, partial [Arachis hypogaea]
YEEAKEEERTCNQREDYSDMVAEGLAGLSKSIGEYVFFNSFLKHEFTHLRGWLPLKIWQDKTTDIQEKRTYNETSLLHLQLHIDPPQLNNLALSSRSCIELSFFFLTTSSSLSEETQVNVASCSE